MDQWSSDHQMNNSRDSQEFPKNFAQVWIMTSFSLSFLKIQNIYNILNICIDLEKLVSFFWIFEIFELFKVFWISWSHFVVEWAWVSKNLRCLKYLKYFA